VPEQARSRHILIKVDANADAKTDAAAKAKAEGILKQLQAGGNWADLAKKYSDDPAARTRAANWAFRRRAAWCRSSTAPSSRRRSATSDCEEPVGYHIVQVEERQTAHAQALNEVLPPSRQR